MQPRHALRLLAATPLTLQSSSARASDLLDPLHPLDPAQEAAWEHALELEHGSDPSRTFVSLGGYLHRTSAGLTDKGVMLLVGFPLGRVPAQASRTEPLRGEVDDGTEAQPVDVAAEPGRVAEQPTQAGRPARAETEASLRVTPRVARACVQAAFRAHGWGTEGDLDAMGVRSRWSAVLPELRLRAARGWDESFRLTPTDSDPTRTQEVTGSSRWLEARMVWRLDRVVFADEEIPLERLRLQRVEAKGKLAGKVLSLLFEWQKASIAASDPVLSSQERITAMLQQAEAEATLDVMTLGWFSSWARGAEGR